MIIPIAIVSFVAVAAGVLSSAFGHLNNLNEFLTWVVFPTVLAGAGAIFLLENTGTYARQKNRGKRPKRSKDNELGSSDLADSEHIRPWLERQGPLDTLLPIENVRGSGGVILRSGSLVIPNEERNRHILIIAKTGSGKTTRLILPILYSDCLSSERSTIVVDSKPEMWDKLAGMTHKYNPGKVLMRFNPLDTLHSQSWNILGKVEDDSDAKLISNTIVMATDNPNARADSPFFRNNALQLLNALMVGLLNDPNDRLSMPRVHQLTHSGKETLCEWLEARPDAIRITRTFVELARSGSQNADTVLSELSMRLAAWDLRAIRSTTWAEELDLENLIQKPSLLIVELRESELEMLRPMANVIVIEILRFLTKRAEALPEQRLPHPVGLVIDEFASALGRLPDIHVKLNTLRSRNVSIVAAIQSIGQIKANYDKDADPVIAGFSTKILMPALDFQDAEWASKETGQMTVRFRVKNAGLNRKLIETFASHSSGYYEQVQQRAVLTPDEIGRPTDNATTFFMPNTAAFQGFLTPYYKVPEMVSRMASERLTYQVRTEPIVYKDPDPIPSTKAQTQKDKEMTPEEVRAELEIVKNEKLSWNETTGVAREWWFAFEEQNAENIATVLTLCRELVKRGASIPDFFLAYVNSNADNIPAILKYLDEAKANGIPQEQLAAQATQAAQAAQAANNEGAAASGTNGSYQNPVTQAGSPAPEQGYANPQANGANGAPTSQAAYQPQQTGAYPQQGNGYQQTPEQGYPPQQYPDPAYAAQGNPQQTYAPQQQAVQMGYPPNPGPVPNGQVYYGPGPNGMGQGGPQQAPQYAGYAQPNGQQAYPPGAYPSQQPVGQPYYNPGAPIPNQGQYYQAQPGYSPQPGPSGVGAYQTQPVGAYQQQPAYYQAPPPGVGYVDPYNPAYQVNQQVGYAPNQYDPQAYVNQVAPAPYAPSQAIRYSEEFVTPAPGPSNWEPVPAIEPTQVSGNVGLTPEIASPHQQTLVAKKRTPAQKAQFDSYAEMARNFLEAGKFKDFRALVQLASEDKLIDDDDILDIETLGARYIAGSNGDSGL